MKGNDRCKCLLNKRGNEIVEAAIVLPVFILIVLSLIGAAVFKFTALRNEFSVQRELVEEIRASTSIMNRIERSTSTSSRPGGWYPYELSKSYDAYGYAINETKIIRMKGEIL